MVGSHPHIKICKICQNEYIANSNRQKYCKPCGNDYWKKVAIKAREKDIKVYRQRSREWIKNNKEKAKQHVYAWRKNNPEKYKEQNREYMKKYYKTPKGKKYLTEYFKTEKGKEIQRKYRRTKKGKIKEKKQSAKRRHKGFLIIHENIFPDEISVDYHHIYPNLPFTIAIPRTLHQSTNGNIKNHVDLCKEWINFYYNIDVDVFLFYHS